MDRAVRIDGSPGGAPAVGVLAFQGHFAAHEKALRRAGVGTRLVRSAEELAGLAGVVLPGGESTTLLKHFARVGMAEPLRRFVQEGAALFGTCAGVIVLAREVLGPPLSPLGLADITVERNAYGRQRESFETPLTVAGLSGPPVAGVFIRAPRITRVGPDVEVLASFEGTPVLVRQGRMLLATFHPELTADPRVHGIFLELVVRTCRGDGTRAPTRWSVR